MATMEIAGVRIGFDDTGTGVPPMLFVHGWGGSRENFAPQLAYFSGRHRVVAFDRSGHGTSAAPEQDYTIPAAADEIAAVCRDLGLDRALVVQHSMDRLAFNFASRYPELVLGLCLLDSPTLAGPDFDAPAAQFLAGLESSHWQEAIRGFADALVFAPGTPEDVKEQTIAKLLATPRHVLISTWRNFIAYPAQEALAEVTCPLLYVRGSFPVDLDRLRALCPQLEVADATGFGHMITLTNPGTVNRALDAFAQNLAVRA